MKTKQIYNTISTLGLSAASILTTALATEPANAGSLTAIPTATPLSEATASNSDLDFTDHIKNALKVYKADSDTEFIQEIRLNWIEQYQIAVVQPSGPNGAHLKPGADPFNQEFRRSWVGANIKFNTGTLLHTWVRLGGLPSRYTYSDGHRRSNYTYAGLFELYLAQEIPGVKGLSVKVGKIKPLFTMEYSTPSSQIKCIERSVVGNFHNLDSNWGIDITYKPNKHFSVYAQLMANDRAANAKSLTHSDAYRDGRGLKGEFGWEDKCFAILGTEYRFNVTESGYQKVVFQYAHDFNNIYDGHRDPGANCYGLAARDALSIGYVYNWDKLTISAEIVGNYKTSGGYGEKNLGFVLQPVYALTPHIELVGRYTLMGGDGACRLAADRYICTQTNAPAWVDRINAFYLGANYYFSERNPDALKLMFGAEYLMTRAGSSNGYCGWEFTSAIRWSF